MTLEQTLTDAERLAHLDAATLRQLVGLVEHDNRVMAWGVGLTIAGCIFATAVLTVVCWLGVQALGWIF